MCVLSQQNSFNLDTFSNHLCNVNQMQNSFIAMAASFVPFPCLRHRRSSHCLLIHAASEESLDPGLPDQTMATRSVSLSCLGPSFLEQLPDGGG
jgi:hypothetical protein